MSESDLAIVTREELQLGSLMVTDYKEVIVRATEIAKSLAKIIEDRRLYTVIGGKKYVQVTGWSTLGAMLGVLPREVENYTAESENGDYIATVELVRAIDQAVIGRGSAIVGVDEKKWSSGPRYARRSMAVTRACGKAFRLAFAWIMTLAGYEATPAEEMDFIDGDAHVPTVNHKSAATVDPSAMTYEQACEVTSSKGEKYGDLPSETLTHMLNAMNKKMSDGKYTAEEADEMTVKMHACHVILTHRAETGA